MINQTSRKIEVINGGRGGFDTSQEVDYLKKRGIKFQPDIVILEYFINDATRMDPHKLVIQRIQEDNDEIENNSIITASCLFRSVKNIIKKHYSTKEIIKDYHDSYYEKNDLWKPNMESLLELKTISEQNNLTLIVVIYPVLYGLDEESHPFSDIIEKIDSFLKKNNIDSYSLLPYFYGYKDTGLWINIYDSHPNEKANDIAACAIRDILLDNYLDALS